VTDLGVVDREALTARAERGHDLPDDRGDRGVVARLDPADV
jgi:hypothetical protein